jgi:phosphate starvation-inducible protein PhoH
MEFTEADVVRHPLVQAIIRAYDRHGLRQGDRAAASEEQDGDKPA